MPADAIICPSCHATLRPKTPVAAGTRIKCPKCTTVFAVPDDEPEEELEEDLSEGGEIVDDEAEDEEPEDDRPIKRKKKSAKKKGIPLWVWLTSGAGALILLCCGGCGIGYLFMPKMDIQTGAPSTSVSMPNYDKIKKGMSEAQVKAVMGTPTAAINVGGTKADSWNQGADTITVTFVNDQATERTCSIGGQSKNGF